ncbi:hypothetical protein ACH4NF_22835 [Streptomyces sp. NPDC017248]|uniref:hypothetical protein n=1 Tax=unclassified Streptomyces TaxID=2593676 RepID=UPI00341FD47E
MKSPWRTGVTPAGRAGVRSGELRVPTAIAVTSADMALPAQDERTMPAVVLTGLDGGTLDEALTGLHTLTEQYGHVVVVCSPATPEPVVRRLYTLRALLESDRVAVFRPALPPLGVAVLARQLRQLASCDLGPGVLACAGRLLTHYLHAGAVLGSVARLDRVPVGLKAHARSWVPGSQFAVLAHPEPQLVRVAPDTTLKGPEFSTWMLVAKGQTPGEWVTGLGTRWGVHGLREVPLPAESPVWWGTHRLVEFCGYLADLSVLYQLVTSVRQTTCHWCGIDVIGDRCVFCSAAPPAPEPPAPHAPEQRAPA